MSRVTAELIERFGDAVNRHDIDEMIALMSDDVVLETTSPPDGERIEGSAAVRAFLEDVFRASPNAAVETEELIAAGDLCTVRCRYIFDRSRPEAGHVRSVDVYRVSRGKIVQKLSYVKG
jgi:ketosteroid isomerase-like protein